MAKNKQPVVLQAPTGSPNLSYLPPFDDAQGTWNVVIETPKGSRNKFAYDGQHRLFVLKKVLPLGAVFPFDFGFLPSTLADDGDHEVLPAATGEVRR
jgi:inorganic pyrophosphatase